MIGIICYGGVREVGGNKVLLEEGGSALMLDFGKRMGAVNAFFDEFLQPRTNSCLRDLLSLGLVPTIPGIYRHDLLNHAGAWEKLQGKIPDHARRLFSTDLDSYDDYIERFGKARIDGILISHAHADHSQDLCFVDHRIPVYCSNITRAILETTQDVGKGGYDSDICVCRQRHCKECGNGSTFPKEPKIDTRTATKADREFKLVKPFERFRVGGFDVEAVPVDHSVPGACAFIITSPSGKVIFYTGDLRFHGSFREVTSSLRERVKGLRPDVFITEGTRVADKNGMLTESGDDESNVERRITEIIRGCSGLAIVDFGWKDTSRFQTMISVAKSTGRVLAVNPKVAYLWAKLRAIDPDTYPDLSEIEAVKVYLERSDSMTYSLADYSNSKHTIGLNVDWGEGSKEMKEAFASKDEEYLRDRLCHYRNGVRAYDIAADPGKFILHAGFFDMNELFDVAPPPGSVFISAMTEPFCDEMRLDQNKLKRWLDHFGIDYGGEEIEHHHVSGHANGVDLLDFIRSAEPKTVIPIHTEQPEIFAKELTGINVHLPELGVAFSV